MMIVWLKHSYIVGTTLCNHFVSTTYSYSYSYSYELTDIGRKYMFTIRKPPEWGIEPIPSKHRSLRGIEYFVLWSSLGVGLLVFSAGSFLAAAKFVDAILAIIVGSVVGSLL